jgi:hypothetical protein
VSDRLGHVVFTQVGELANFGIADADAHDAFRLYNKSILYKRGPPVRQ